MRGEGTGAVQAAGWGEPVLTLQHPPQSHLGMGGRRAGSAAKPGLGYFKRCEDSFLGGHEGHPPCLPIPARAGGAHS